ncbi:MAG: hypothetical protein D6806_03255 [Deltaproteobacteria bacterium]|nr:MAG: hypothetical protein D6806_03255 [Deltaproteobacteria bacterium]
MERVLNASDTFVVAKFSNIIDTDSLSVGLTTAALEYTKPARKAELREQRNEIFALTTTPTTLDTVASLADPCVTRRYEIHNDCSDSPDGGDGSTSAKPDCKETEIVEHSNCNAPEWHYEIPEQEDGVEYGMFLASDTKNLGETKALLMLFKVTKDEIDMSMIEGGRIFRLDKLEEVLRSKHKEGSHFFW